MTTSINNSVNNSSAAAESNESKKGSRSSNPNNLNFIVTSSRGNAVTIDKFYRRAIKTIKKCRRYETAASKFSGF